MKLVLLMCTVFFCFFFSGKLKFSLVIATQARVRELYQGKFFYEPATQGCGNDHSGSLFFPGPHEPYHRSTRPKLARIYSLQYRGLLGSEGLTFNKRRSGSDIKLLLKVKKRHSF